MKTGMMLKSVLGFTVGGVAFLLGCAEESKVVNHYTPQPYAGSTPVVTAPAPAQDGAPASAASSSDESVAAPAISAEKPPLSPGLTDLIKLAEAGFGDDVLIAHIQRSQIPYQPTTDELVYLNDVGFSEQVVTVLIQKSGRTVDYQPPVTTESPREQASFPAPTNDPAPLPEAADPTYDTAPPPQPAASEEYASDPHSDPEAGYFYDSLSPYGDWVYVSDYGWSWRPTVVAVNPDWRPYYDRGRWQYTDHGWYWQSHYSWGWAPFHYGRWYYHPSYRWCWLPGRVWGPAWVSWRYSNAYCGWAPLPPSARFRSGFGFSYYGSRVGVGFDFGLSYHHYAFVPYSRFCDPYPYRYGLASHYARGVYNQTTVINNYITGDNNTIINEGIGRERIQSASRGEITRVAIKDLPVSEGTIAKPARLDRDGNELLVYRPALEAPGAATQKRVESRGSQEPRYGDAGSPGPSSPSSKLTPPRLKPASEVISSEASKGRSPVLANTPARRAPSAPVSSPGQVMRSRNESTPSQSLRGNSSALPAPKTPNPSRRAPLTLNGDSSRPNVTPARPGSSPSLIRTPTQPQRSEPRPQPVETLPRKTPDRSPTPAFRRPEPVAPQAPGVRSAITLPQNSRTIIQYHQRPASQPRQITRPSFPGQPQSTPSFRPPSSRSEVGAGRSISRPALPQPKSVTPRSAPRETPRSVSPPRRPAPAPAQPRSSVRSSRPEPRATPRAAPPSRSRSVSPPRAAPSRPQPAAPATRAPRRNN